MGRGPLSLTVEACLGAIKDAGLTRADIDGLVCFPGNMGGWVQGFDPGTREVQDALRLSLSWHGALNEGPSQLGAVVNACMAVATGLAANVLVYRTVVGFRGSAVPVGTADRGVSGPLQWLLPFGALGAANSMGLYVRRHMHEFGTTREQLGAIAINARANAALNPKAVYRAPLPMSEYLAARMVSDPICLLDCDVPCDGSTAFVVSRSEHAADSPGTAVQIDAVGTAIRTRSSSDQWPDLRALATRDAAEHMWSRTSLKPSDVDVAQLYDGFSFLALTWLEDLGFCSKGEGGPFVEGGKRIALTGEVPLNTGGGQLSAGRLHGFGLLHEACLQLRGEAGARQVSGAEVALVSNGTGTFAGCMLLTRRR